LRGLDDVRRPPELDSQLGMLAYSTPSGGCGGISIRESPERFVVSEVLAGRPPEGPLPTFVVTKVNRNTIDVAEELGRRLGCRIKFWGLKDKRSISTQIMQCARPRAPGGSVRGDGWVARPIGLWGELGPEHFAGNSFRISISARGPEGGRCQSALRAAGDSLASRTIANFFGYQRFGAVNQNHIIGRCLVKRAEGCPRRDELRSIPARVRKLQVNAYQSYLFNLALSRVLLENGELPLRSSLSHRVVRKPFERALEEPIAGPADGVALVPSAPVPGYSYRSRGDAYSRALDEVMREEGISPRDFYVDDMQEVSAEGGWRPAVVLGRLEARGDGELIRINMLLQRGSYATVVLREALKPEDPVASGFTA
jgi:tRNA(Glu) U13 pseudouridine synthase TruD